MSKIGYARVSTKEQNLDRQLESLNYVSKVFSDKISGQSTERPQLKAMLEYIREGDIVVVTELDRLGRNNKDLTTIMNEIQQKGATLEVLNLPSMNGIDDENLRRLINNLVIELYKYQAEAERKRVSAVLPEAQRVVRASVFFHHPGFAFRREPGFCVFDLGAKRTQQRKPSGAGACVVGIAN